MTKTVLNRIIRGMNIFLLVVKGIVTGMAAMIPGVSAGSMVMSMGLYGDLMLLISGGRAEKKSTFSRLLPYGAGLVIGVFAFAFLFKAMLTSYPFQTACVFIGLILGGLPMLWRKVDKKAITPGNIAPFAISVCVIVAMLLLSRNATAANSLAPSVGHFFLTLVLGFFAAATMIIPGISGSALMLILGYYNEITDRVTRLATGFGTLNGAMIGENLLVFLPFLVGAVVGVVLVAKAIRRMIERFPNGTYFALIGLMAASPIAVIAKIDINFAAVGFLGYAVSLVCLVGGFFVAFLLADKE